MIFPSPKSTKTISLHNELVYKHEWNPSKSSNKRTPRKSRMTNYVNLSNNYLSNGSNNNSSFIREQSPMNIEESNETNTIDNEAKYEKSDNNEKIPNEMEYQTSIGKDFMIGKDSHERHPRLNLNKCSQIDDQSYSNQYHNKDLSNYHDNHYYPINKCENCQQLIKENDEFQIEIGKLKCEIEHLKSINESLQVKYNLLDNSKKDLLKNLEKKKLENKKYKSKIEFVNRKQIEMDQLNENLLNENGKLVQQINNSESEKKLLNDLIIENENLTSEMNKYKSENEKKNQKIIESDHIINQLQDKIEELKEQSKIENENLKLQINKYDSEIKQLKIDEKSLKSNNENLQSKFDDLNNSNKDLLEENENMRKSRLNDLKSENEDHKLQIRKYKSEIESSKRKQFEMDQSNNYLQNKIEKLRKEIINLESENKLLNNLKIKNENLKSQIIKCVPKIRKCQLKNKRLKGRKTNLKKKFQSLNSQSVKSSSENINLNECLPIGNDNSTIGQYKPTDFMINEPNDSNNTSESDNFALNISSNIEESEVFIEDLDSSAESNVSEKKTVTPLGFANPKGYCYLNSVVQVLGSCEDFKNDIYNYELISSEKTNDSIFVEGLFNLIRAVRECNKESLDKSLNIVQQNITESSFGDDVYKCFMNLLTRVSNVVKTKINRDHFTSQQINISEKAKTKFAEFQNKNPGFVFDNFYGQLTFQTICTVCHHVCNESFQLMKSLPLPVPNSISSVTLNSCINLFFNESAVELDEPMNCYCKNGSTTSLKSITKLTHGPKYLFAYLNRGSYTDDGDKNNTQVTCDNLYIDLITLENQSIKYKLIAVIDHVGNSAYGHYYCKCSFESEEWWLLNDSQVKRLKNKNEIVTKNTIVFLLKMTS